jgi:RND family efflux transporter MFP subunit
MRYLPYFPIVLITLLVSCGGAPPQKVEASNSPVIPVETAAVAAQPWPDVYEATGTVRARTTAVISSKVMAYVEQVTVDVGSRVRAGQTLIVLDSRDLDASVRRAQAAQSEVESAIPEADNGVAAAKASLDLAQTTFKRIDELKAKNSVSNQEFDEANARLKAAQANYEMALSKRKQLNSKMAQVEQEIRAAAIMRGYATIAAPFAGVVTAKTVEPGNLAAPGAPLLSIEQQGGYRLEAAVEESKLPFVHVGQAVDISLEAVARKLSARVSEIVPAVDASSRAYTVKIDLPAIPELRSGIFGRAYFPMGTNSVLAIPSAAMIERGQLQSVYVVEDGTARDRLITTGRRSNGAVEVLSGLSAGEKVVAPVPAQLADGSKVEVRQ